MVAVGLQDTTNYHSVMPKAATPQFLLLEIVVLTSFSRAAGATREARFFLIAAFCRLAKSLSHSELMGWLVGAVGIEPNTLFSAAPRLAERNSCPFYAEGRRFESRRRRHNHLCLGLFN